MLNLGMPGENWSILTVTVPGQLLGFEVLQFQKCITPDSVIDGNLKR